MIFFRFSTNNNGVLNSKSIGNKKLSGMVLLCLAKYQSQLGENVLMGKKESLILQMCKCNEINLTNYHHGSTGKYYFLDLSIYLFNLPFLEPM